MSQRFEDLDKRSTKQESAPVCNRHSYTPDGRPDQEALVHEPDPDYIYGSGARDEVAGGRTRHLHTLDEYLALPDDRRVELIDGVFYDMAAPSGIHQKIALRLWRELENCIEKKGCPCEAQAAPFDVCLDKYTVVQPDVMVFCEDPSQALGTRATAAPDLVIEVLSPGTASKDRLIKLQKYREHGVKELWLVSPMARQIEVYLFFKGDKAPRIYTFSDKVPVHFSDDLPEGNCEIDFPTVTRGLPLP